MGLSNSEVANRWAKGRKGNSGNKNFTTDGETLYSYSKCIGFTDRNGKKIAVNFRGARHGLTVTTTQHVAIAHLCADELREPKKNGDLPFERKDADELGRVIVGLNLNPKMTEALRTITANQSPASVKLNASTAKGLQNRMLARRGKEGDAATAQGIAVARYLFGHGSVEPCPGCLGWPGAECPIIAHHAVVDEDSWIARSWVKYCRFIESLSEPDESESLQEAG